MANLAIKGHSKRGSEVIERLEMLGGINSHNLYGDESYAYYTIDSDKEIKGGIYVFGDEQLCYFTLEQFEEKFPYKVGDKVSSKYLKNYEISKMEWESINNRVIYKLRGMGWYSADELQPYKEETMDRKYNVEEYLKVWKETEKGLEVVVNDNFELKEDNEKFYIIKKQLQYPKTYVDCCEVLGSDPSRIIVLSNRKDIIHEENKHCYEMYNLYQLLICRDAYWKIAGEQMGLDAPWEPDWSNGEETKFCIYKTQNIISLDIFGVDNRILAFPEEEMRYIFYENFKDLIEECKELL